MPKSRVYTILGLLILAAIVYLLGNASVCLWDRDEPRYAQTSRQMVESGDWIVPMLLDQPREKKPVFIYWCQAASMKLLGISAFAARLPSVIFVSLTVLSLALLLARNMSWNRAICTAFVFASSGLTMIAAKFSITDGVLILFVTISQLCLYEVWSGRGTWAVFIMLGLAMGFGMLTKGPVAPAVMAMTLLVLLFFRWLDKRKLHGPSPQPSPPSTRERGQVARWIVACLLAGLVLAPWLYAIEQRLPDYIVRTIKQEVLVRAVDPQEGHKGPPGYYLLTIWVTFLPWSVLLPCVMIAAWKRRSRPQVRFALAAIIGPWIMFEIVQTKLMHYFLPVFPALAFLTADFVIQRRRSLRIPLWMGFGTMAIFTILYAGIIPRLPQLRISKRVGELLIREGATHPGDVTMIDYKETSLPFYQGGTIRPQRDNKFLEHAPPEQWPRWMVLTDRIWNDTPPAIRENLEIVGTVHGINLADGLRVLDVMVVRKR